MAQMTSLDEVMPQWQARIESVLDHWLPPADRLPARLHQAMRYTTLEGGKRIRPLLVYAAGLATGQSLDVLDGPACAIEMIHAYSLVHDDLPCMDDDDLRRGKATVHKAYDEATAVLVGDALQARAFEVLTLDETMNPDSGVRLAMILNLAQASGSHGMVGGQAIDLAAVGQRLSIVELEAMHIHKTGALIRASVAMATLNLPEMDWQKVHALDHYAKCLGLAFQIRDDILDIEGNTETLGKQSGADKALDKPTFPDVLGMAESKAKAGELHQQALDSLSVFGSEASVLRGIANYIVMRSS